MSVYRTLILFLFFGCIAWSDRMVWGTQPNIVLIISDDHGWTDYGFMGNSQVRTPNLDRLARESLTFKRGYVPSSLCSPSLATILTGRFPHEHGVTSNDPPAPKGVTGGQFHKSAAFREGRERMNQRIDTMPTLPRQLVAQGYLAFQTGKWWQGDFKNGGFTHGMTQGEPGKGGRHGDKGLEIGRKTMAPIFEFIDDATRNQKPFLVWYAPMLPHTPHNPPVRLLKKYQEQNLPEPVAAYYASVEWFDETCGELITGLEERKLRENTVIVYVTDNGWIQNPNSLNMSARKSKQSPYDGGLRTPIMVNWPAKIAPRFHDHPVSSIDIAPTILKLADVSAPVNLPGINLLDIPAIEGRQTVFGNCFTHNYVDFDHPEKSLRWRWCISNGWKLILPDATNEPNEEPELYRIVEDEKEERNLMSAHPEEAARLSKLLDGWWKP